MPMPTSHQSSESSMQRSITAKPPPLVNVCIVVVLPQSEFLPSQARSLTDLVCEPLHMGRRGRSTVAKKNRRRKSSAALICLLPCFHLCLDCQMCPFHMSSQWTDVRDQPVIVESFVTELDHVNTKGCMSSFPTRIASSRPRIITADPQRTPSPAICCHRNIMV